MENQCKPSKKRKDKKNTPQKNYKNNSSDAVIEML